MDWGPRKSVDKRPRSGAISPAYDGGVSGTLWWRRSTVVGCRTVAAEGTGPTRDEFLVSRWSDRLGVCVGIRVDRRLSRRILELRHCGDFAVVILGPTRATEQKRGGSVCYCLQISIRSPRSWFHSPLESIMGNLQWLDGLYSCFPHSLPSLISSECAREPVQSRIRQQYGRSPPRVARL